MDDSHPPIDAAYHDNHELTPEQLDEYEELINRKPAPSLADQFAWVFQIPASPAGGGEATPPLVTRKRKYNDMATPDELNSHAAARKRLPNNRPGPKRYAVPPRIRKGPPRADTEALHSTRGRLWKKQGDRIVFHSRAPNKHALQLRRVHHYTSALLDYAMSFKRTRHVHTSWYSIRGLYQCLMEHVNSVASKFPSPRMKAWVSYLALFKNMMDLNIEKENLRRCRMDISNQLSEALSREQAQNLPTPPSGSTSEASLEDIPSNSAHQQHQHQHQHDRSRSTSQPTPPSDPRSANAHGQSQSPTTHPPPAHPDPHTSHPNQTQNQGSTPTQTQTQGHPPRTAGVAPELPRHGTFTLDWRAAQELMNILQRTRIGYNTGERRENVRDLNPAVVRAHFPRTYARAFGPDGVGNTAEDMRAWRHIHGDDLPPPPTQAGNTDPAIEPLGLADEWEVHDLDEEEMMGGDFPYPHTPEDVVWILVLGKSLLSEMDFLGMADEEQARVDSRPHLPHPHPHSHSHSHPHPHVRHPSRYRPESSPHKVVKQEPISQTNSPLLPLRDSPSHLRASSSPGASSSSSSSSSETVIKSEMSSS